MGLVNIPYLLDWKESLNIRQCTPRTYFAEHNHELNENVSGPPPILMAYFVGKAPIESKYCITAFSTRQVCTI